MTSRNSIAASVLSLALLIVPFSLAQEPGDIDTQTTYVVIAKRATLAVNYPEGDGTSVDMAGSSLNPRVRGKAEVKRTDGRSRIKLEIEGLDHPQNLGSFYTTYVVWAVAPEGQADNVGELRTWGGDETETEVTTPYQSFGLIVTAEPHSLVRLPGPAIVAENVLRKGTKGGITASRIEYRGDAGSFYRDQSGAPDFQTPASVLGARKAVEIARRAGAERFAGTELRDAENKLAALEQIWTRRGKDKHFSGEAQEVMRLAEQARALAVERREQARLEAERRRAGRAIASAQSDADRARDEAAAARVEAANYREALQRSETELARARERVEQARTEAEKAKASEELSRVEAEHARLEAEQARQDRDAAQQRLLVSLSAILETRREARGLIVNLSDVLFDFNKATLKPGAKEKLSKLTGILLAYPGDYRIEIEGHTDSIGSDEYNFRLSESRAGAVRDYLLQAGLPSNRIAAVRGLGKTRPVVGNDTPEGRQMNRRVEIVIMDAEIGQR
jgi:outer membrane protein OmpA-like peptidoglycan-associated protein